MSRLRTRLKNVIKKVAHWTVPPAFHDIASKQWRKLKNRFNVDVELEALFQRNKKFKDIHKGQRCFILATGPSINKQNLKPLRNEICIAVSAFYVHKDISTIRPLYHVEAPNHPPFGIELLHTGFEGYQKNYSDRTIYFFGHRPYEFSYFNYLKQNHQLKNDNFYFLNYSCTQHLDERIYRNPIVWDICKPLFTVRTVIYSAIQIAVYMGFQEIYLLGCDHDYLMDLTRITDHHFYKDEESGISDAEHLSASITEDWFRQYYRRWKEYRLMNEYLTSKNCRIFNATNGGMLDVFPRVNFEDVVNP